jgi:hypothetical protein
VGEREISRKKKREVESEIERDRKGGRMRKR